MHKLLLAFLLSVSVVRAGTINATGTGVTVKSWNTSSFDFTTTTIDTPRITSQGGSSTPMVVDHTITRTTATAYKNDKQINYGITLPSPLVNSAPVFSSSNTGVATVDQNGKVTNVSNGSVTIYVTTPILRRGIPLTLASVASATLDAFNAYTAGTLGASASSGVDSLIAGLTASNGNKNLWSTRNDSTAAYVWNTSCWSYGIDMTCISPWNSYGGNTRAGTLISPRHIITATHFPIINGSTIRFIKQDGTVITRTVSAQAVVNSDICISILDSDVPSGINFCKILPANGISAYLPSLASSVTIPVLSTNQTKKALVIDLYLNNAVNTGWVAFQFPSNAQRLSFAEPIISGDSGSPSFAVINGNLALLCCWNYGGNGGGGPWPSGFISAINATMHTLSVGQSAGTDYQLTTMDLSGFTSF